MSKATSNEFSPGGAWLFTISKRLLRTAAVVLFLLAGAAPAVAQAIGQEVPSAAPKQPVLVVPAVGDAEIENRLQRILQSTGWFEAPRVSVRDGVVSLDGSAATQEHRNWAGVLAENVQGTVAVVNRIEVQADVRSTLTRARDEFASFYRQVLRAWPLVALAAAIILVTWLVAKLVTILARRFFSKRIASPLLLGVVARASSFPIFILGFYFVLQFSGLTRLAITVLGGTGLIGIVVGFAFRDIAENFLASILLSVRNPFRSGELIEVAGHTGIVQNLNMRTTVLLSLDGNHVQIPNATVFKATIKNYSSTPNRRAEFTVGIGYDSSTLKAQTLIAKVLREHPAVLDAPDPLVLVDELGAATVNIRVYYWFDSATYSPAKINSALLRLTKNALLEGGIELPDPAREVVFPKGVPLVRMESAVESKRVREGHTGGTPLGEETAAATIGEGDLSNEATEVRERSKGSVTEASENLLKG